MKTVWIVKGCITYNDGKTEDGKWEYIPQTKTCQMVEGVVTQANGITIKGRREYVKEWGGMDLIDGSVTYPSGNESIGRWEYIPKLKELQVFFSTFSLFRGALFRRGVFSSGSLGG